MDELDLGATIRGFSPGQKLFGRYTLKKQLGRGGMGVVWQARDESLEQDVAIKLLPEMVATDPVSIRDLKRETRRSQSLAHPHILKVHDFVEGGGLCGISMELVEGGTLSARRLEEPGETFTPAQLGPWVRQLCEALDYAHTKAKVVHRDLKPANLMLTPDDDLKVADFGIAASLSESVTRVSKQAGSSGTPLYMSPQQMMGDDPAVTDDLYALGATLYELLTGKPPFFSGNVLMQVQSKVPVTVNERLRSNGHTGEPVPAEWEQTIAACLAKEPKERPQSAGEVAERLGLVGGMATKSARTDAAQAGRVIPNAPSAAPQTPNPKSKTQTRTPLIAALVAGVILAAGLGWYFGIHVPEQKRLAQIALEEAASRAASQAGEKFGIDPPQFGQRWVVPGLSIELIPIAAGSFRMGTDSADDDLNLAKPVTQVTISKPYWLGRTEVTQEQWQTLMGANPSKFKAATRPVESITWEQAMEFCEKLTARERAEGTLPAGYVYRLPTEAQWEYACRAGTTGHHAGDADAMGWNENNSGKSTQPVGSKQANAWGLHDMHGNVAEWCLDFKYGQYPGGAVADFVSQGVARTKRGGNWGDHPVSTASWARAYVADDPSDEFTGLRVALVPDVPVPRPEKESPPVAKIAQPQSGQRMIVPDPSIEMIPIAAGSFLMGSDTGGDSDERPVTRVTLSKPFWLGKTEVTQAQWTAIMGSNPSFFKGPDLPVEQISWNDAIEFCRKLTEREQAAGRLPEGYTYALPTEAQWEYACRAGTTGDHAGNLEALGWYELNSGGKTRPVGQKATNGWGLADMHGNVSEWTRDGFGIYSGGEATDPFRTNVFGRVYRGGNWGGAVGDCRSAKRSRAGEGAHYGTVGFRVALVPDR